MNTQPNRLYERDPRRGTRHSRALGSRSRLELRRDSTSGSVAMLARMGAQELTRVRAGDGTIVCERCEVAESALARMRGLLGRKGLEPGTGMLINPAPSVMTFFMRFAIDVVFLDRDRKVVGVRHELGPWRVAGARHAVAALELPSGAAAQAGIEEGDVLVLEDVEAAGTGN